MADLMLFAHVAEVAAFITLIDGYGHPVERPFWRSWLMRLPVSFTAVTLTVVIFTVLGSGPPS